MTIEVRTLVEDRIAEIPSIAGQDDLVEIHRQLVESAERGPEFLEAAKVIRHLSSALRDFPGAYPLTVALVFTHVIVGLRQGWLRPLADVRRFEVARAWLSNIYIQAAAAKAKAAAESAK